MWTLESAAAFAREIEAFAPDFGCHVALTGGCLYRDGQRKDCDLVIYRIRQTTVIDMRGLFGKFNEIGMIYDRGQGFCHKMTLVRDGDCLPVDLLFPEDGNAGSQYLTDEEQPEPQTAIR
jgi:hypothetical protein